jgi:hypothetical protein
VYIIKLGCGDREATGIGTTSAGEEMKNNKVVARGEEKLYISAANSKRLLFPYPPPTPTVFFEAKEKMTPYPS